MVFYVYARIFGSSRKSDLQFAVRETSDFSFLRRYACVNPPIVESIESSYSVIQNCIRSGNFQSHPELLRVKKTPLG